MGRASEREPRTVEATTKATIPTATDGYRRLTDGLPIAVKQLILCN
jgi:hypothetical protein